jgi:WhiB family redox-sensing transcriptional regulator
MAQGKTMKFLIDAPVFDEARCATIEDKDFFFPDGRKAEADRLPQLKQICFSCIHRKECLEYALEKQIPYGFWGGKSTLERQAILVPNLEDVAVSGKALEIKNLWNEGTSAKEIAVALDTSLNYVKRIVGRIDAAKNKGAVQSHQQINDSYGASVYLSEQA